METINDVMIFLNQLGIYNFIRGVEYTSNNIKNILMDEFIYGDVDKLVEMLGTPDGVNIKILGRELYSDNSLITTLSYKIYDLSRGKCLRKLITLKINSR